MSKIPKQSPSQTAGPYVHIGCTPNFSGISNLYDADLGRQMITGAAKGTPITIKGTITDGDGALMRDAMVEIWQADATGNYPPAPQSDPHFTGFGRTPTDMKTGKFTFQTIKPGAVPYGKDGVQAPHITFWIVARGINVGLHTRMYFADEDNSFDPVLTLIEPQGRIKTLLAHRDKDGVYWFNIILQGSEETIFFDI